MRTRASGGISRRNLQVVAGLPPVPPVESRGAVGGYSGHWTGPVLRLARFKWSIARCPDPSPRGDRSLRRRNVQCMFRSENGNPERGSWPFESIRWENDPLDRFLDHLPLLDQDQRQRRLNARRHRPPSHRQRRDMSRVWARLVRVNARDPRPNSRPASIKHGQPWRPRMAEALSEPGLRVPCWPFDVSERHPGAPQPEVRAQYGQQSRLQHRAEPAAARRSGERA